MIATGTPASDLAGRIEACWSLGIEGETGVLRHELLPDPSANLVFRFSRTGQCRMVLVGPTAEKVTAEFDAASAYFCVRFRPGQVPRLTDVRPSDLVGRFVELDAIGGVRVDDLAERLASFPDHASRQQVMEAAVRGAGSLVRDVRARRAAALLDAHGGALRVEALADALGMGTRSLERLFVVHHGMSPKRFARLVRLRHALSRIARGGPGTLADVAAACGYADQAHFTRDFRALTGRSPGERGPERPRKADGPAATRIVHRWRA